MQQLRPGSSKLQAPQQPRFFKLSVHAAPCFHHASASSAPIRSSRAALTVRAETGSSTRASATAVASPVLEPPATSSQSMSSAGKTTTAAARLPALKRARTLEELTDPLQIGASGAASHKLDAFTGDVSLTRYMELPVEQYFVLDPKQIQFLGGDRFLLLVPRINILNVWIEPVVEVSVSFRRGPTPSVLLKAENARIRGSELIENLKLDQRFVLQFQTELTWSTDIPGSGSSVSGSGSYDGGSNRSSNSSGSSSSTTAAIAAISAPTSSSSASGKMTPAGKGVISGAARLDVWSEVVPPFNVMPRSALQASCNLVLRGLVGSLLPLFVRKLSEDYMKWAQDPAYRAERALRSSPLA